MTGKDDKRRHDRFSADDVHGKFSYSVGARVLNISMGGLAVRTQTQLTIGREYRFRLGVQRDAMQLTGAVRWCRLAGTERGEDGDIVPVYEAGISFDDVLSDKAEELLQFMEKNIIVDLRRRVSGRFTVEGERPLELESSSSFEVKQISLSGMMLESVQSASPETRLQLEIRLGDDFFTSGAKVIYMSEIGLEEGERERQTPRYQMGVELIHTSTENRTLLESFIRTELNSQEDDGKE